MGQVTITLNNRTYRLSCGPGEEARLRELADHLGLRIERLAMDFGQHGDERLLVMAALLATDELLEAKGRLAASNSSPEDAEGASAVRSHGPARVEPAPTPASAPVAPTFSVAAGPSVEASLSAEPPDASPSVAPVSKPAVARNSLESRLAEAKLAAKASVAPTKAGTA